MNVLTEAVANATVVSSLTSIGGEMLATINAIAPVAMPLLGAFMVWKAGIRMFKTLTSK